MPGWRQWVGCLGIVFVLGGAPSGAKAIPPGAGAWKPDGSVLGAYHAPAGLAGGGQAERVTGIFQGGLTYAPSRERQVGVSIAGGIYDYRFSGSGAFASPAPWDRVRTVQAGGFWRQAVGDRWSWLLAPSVRAQAETGADLGDGVTAGAMLGTAWRAHPRLTLGPGIGLFSEIEDDPSPFFFPMIDWKITDRLSIGTGRGTGATRGPGLGLTWQATPAQTLGFGGRYDRLRFRLDDVGDAPGGVGQERTFTLVASVSQRLSPWATLMGMTGVSFAGDMRTEDRDGRHLTDADLDPAWMLGAHLALRWP